MPSSRRWIERLNELRLVRATLAWETFLEESLICLVRGAPTLSGLGHPLSGPTAKNTQQALKTVLGTATYGNWLNESWALKTTAPLFASTNPYQLLASPVFTSIRRVRNRTVHRSEIAKKEFRLVVRDAFGTDRPGMTPGRLLGSDPHGVVIIDHYLLVLKAGARSILA